MTGNIKKTALVTGASSGIGKSTVLKMLKKGFTVYAASRRPENMADLEKNGARILRLDVRDDISIKTSFARILQEQGRIDIVINNAGYGGFGMIESVAMDEARRQFEVNVFGAVNIMKAALPYMRKQKSGHIINISSVIGKATSPMIGWYGASKHALESLSDSLRGEVSDFGISVTLIEPGAVDTGFLDKAFKNLDSVEHGEIYKSKVAGFKKAFTRSYKKAASPEKVAETIIKALESKEPKTRYSVGRDAKMMIFMKRYLPDKLYDRIIRSVLGMKQDSYC